MQLGLVDVSLLAPGDPAALQADAQGTAGTGSEEHIGDRSWQGKGKPGVLCSGCVATSFWEWSCWRMLRTGSTGHHGKKA